MKERSLGERIVAIFGVLLGTVAWVVRLLYSLVKGMLPGGSTPEEDDAGASRQGAGDTAKAYASGLREKSDSLLHEARQKSHNLVEDAREKVDGVMHRDEEQASGESRFSAEGSASGDRADVSSTQHQDIGGVPETGPVASANLSAMDATYDEQYAGSMDDDDAAVGTGVTEGIPNLEEPGEGDEAAMYGSEAGSLMGRDEDTGYAGQPMSESDIGIDRGDSISGFADSGDRTVDPSTGVASDEMNVDQEETTGGDVDSAMADRDDAVGSEDESVPAASRGWQEPEDDVLQDDPLYGDFESSGTGGEIDLRNDEMDDEDAAGMHIVGSPDEPFIEDEDASQSLGLVDAGTEPPFDTTTDVDEIGEEPVAINEDRLAADALGHPAGDSAASGDLGPDQSPDDATWPPGESRPDYDVLGAYDGSGVDEFADDAVAESMIEDVTGERESGAAGEASGSQGSGGTGSGSADTGSVAWASSSGVIDRDLTKPLSSDELQSGGDAAAGGGEGGEPGRTEADAGLKDVAADVAEEIDSDMGGGDVATGTTMSGAGQSAGAMTSDDAANGDEGTETMTTDRGTVETGGVPATDVEEGEGESDDDLRPDASEGGRSFNDVLPDSQYASSVGYDTLKADEMGNIGRDAWRGSFLTETSTSGMAKGLTPESEPNATLRSDERSAPAGVVRGDGSGICPAGYPIKGNASSKIYHRPSDSSYERTNAEFCFATEEDARAAGFRPRKG